MTAIRGIIVLSPSLMPYSGRLTRRQLKQLSSYPGAKPASSVGHGPKFIRVGRGLKSSGTPFPHRHLQERIELAF
jgi:hypothetical protein